MNHLIPRIAMACLFVFTSLACTSQATTDRPPNVVIFYTDDMGYTDLSSYDNNLQDTQPRQARGQWHAFTSFMSARLCVLQADPH